MKTIAIFLALASFAFAQEQKTAEQVYKNIVALKGVPADQVMPTMQFIAAALGMECGDCHVQGKPEADDKNAKKSARQMISMTIAINHGHFGDRTQVTCFTCHRGSERPVAVPPVMESDARPKPEARPATASGQAPTADDVVAKYIAAVGGADAIKKVTTRQMTGKILAMGSESPIELWTKAPNKRISVSDSPAGHSITAFDGTSGWMGSARGARDMSPLDAEGAALDAEFYLPLRLKEMFTQIRRGRPEEVNGTMCEVLNAARQGHAPVRLYFDQKSGLLVRMIRYTDTPVGRNPVQIDYADYRDADGVKIPFRWTLARTNGRFTIQIAEVKSNVPIEDSKFAKPAASDARPQ
jgi:outer membrane lipoprotein-sorting protein